MGGIVRLEWFVAATVVVVLAGLVIAEPDVVEAPVESTRTIASSLGGTAVVAVALVVMLRLRVHPVAECWCWESRLWSGARHLRAAKVLLEHPTGWLTEGARDGATMAPPTDDGKARCPA